MAGPAVPFAGSRSRARTQVLMAGPIDRRPCGSELWSDHHGRSAPISRRKVRRLSRHRGGEVLDGGRDKIAS
eukprot:4332512-Pyramimonas_sp.AAC.1